MTSEALDASNFEEPARALVRGEWSIAATLLVQIAATAASGNPFVGIAAGVGVEWLWATAAARSATATLKRAEAEFEKRDEEVRVAFVQKCLREGFAGVADSGAPTDAVPSDVKAFAELLEEGLSHILRSLAHLHSKVDAVLESVGPSPKFVGEHLRTATKRWSEDVDTAIAGVLTLPRTELRAELDAALKFSPVVVILGESGVGKSALAKAALLGGNHVFAIHAFELQSLLNRIDLDLLSNNFVPDGAFGTFIVDGVEHLGSAEKLRPLALLLRVLRPSNVETRWRIVFTCRPKAWNTAVDDLGAPDALLHAEEVCVAPLMGAELQTVADSFPTLGLLRTGIDNGALRKLKLLDLVARQPTKEHRTVRSNLNEAQLADWYWRHAIVTRAHGYRRGEIVKSLARRRQETGSLRAPLSAMASGEVDLLASLQDEGVLRVRDETVSLAHDWLETIGLERVLMEAYGSGDVAKLVAVAAQPGWHASLQLAALHCLESDGPTRWLSTLNAIGAGPGERLRPTYGVTLRSIRMMLGQR